MIGGGWSVRGVSWVKFGWWCCLFVGAALCSGGVDSIVYFCEHCLDGLVLFLIWIPGV